MIGVNDRKSLVATPGETEESRSQGVHTTNDQLNGPSQLRCRNMIKSGSTKTRYMFVKQSCAITKIGHVYGIVVKCVCDAWCLARHGISPTFASTSKIASLVCRWCDMLCRVTQVTGSKKSGRPK